MINKGPSLGCAATNNGQSSSVCLCASGDFAYGVRDCSSESCPSGTDISGILSYGASYCQEGMLCLSPQKLEPDQEGGGINND